MRNLLAKFIEKYQQGTLLSAINLRAKPYLIGLKYLPYNPASKIKIHCPDYIEPPQDAHEKSIVERIFKAYKLMKTNQNRVGNLYRPSSLWQNQLNTSYSYLNQSLISDDISQFHFF